MAAMWRGLPELHVAIHRGQFHDARQLVSAGDDVNCRDGNHRTPLILCALVEQETWGVGIARMLLETGALAGLADKQGRNALIYACIHRRLELVEILLSAVDFDLNHRDRFGNTALFYAATGGNADVVAALVRKLKHFGETLDKANKCGMTPLLEACRLGHERVARIMVDNGANVERRDGVRHWNALDWQQEHDRHLHATDRARNRSYDKPWLTGKKTAGEGESELGQLRRTTSMPGISQSDSHGLSDERSSSESLDISTTPDRARSVPQRSLSRAKTMPAMPNLNSAKLVGVTRNWIGEGGSKELIRAKFYPSPVPFANPRLTTDAERTHNAYGQWKMTQNLHPVNSFSSSQCSQNDSALWRGEFRQIFKRYENQVSKSFRRKARVPPPGYHFRSHSPPQLVHPSITVDSDRKAPSSRLSRRQSNMDMGLTLKRLPSVNSIDTASVSSRRGTSSAVKGGKREPESSTSSIDSAGAAKMVMNAFRRRKSNAFSSSSSITRSLEDETDTKTGNPGIDKSSATSRTRKLSVGGSVAGSAIFEGNNNHNAKM
ncbi:ankyrin repeat domain-containing protein 63-like [Patiria miniata]|uniref:Uncharacterized protein n=1 Tax=Patiria miniata TaxID=46514 RepID=A0A914AYK5_PATMI|nr:ankyrin repeat domain-containing protein 63-like [Patiria miniata]